MKIISYCLPRSGSTLQLNLYKATIELLDLYINTNNICIIKRHPQCYIGSPNLLKEDLLSRDREKIFVILTARDLISRITSINRTLYYNQINTKRQFSDLCMKTYWECLNQAKYQLQTVRSFRQLGIPCYGESYTWLTTQNLENKIISNAKIILKEFFSVKEHDKLENFVHKNDVLISSLSKKYGLTRTHALDIQKNLNTKEFNVWDKRTDIHGNHISSNDEKILLQNTHNFFEEKNYTEVIKTIDKKNLELLDMIRNTRD